MTALSISEGPVRMWSPTLAEVNLSDAVSVLIFLFQGGPAHALAVPGEERTRCVPLAGCR